MRRENGKRSDESEAHGNGSISPQHMEITADYGEHRDQVNVGTTMIYMLTSILTHRMQ